MRTLLNTRSSTKAERKFHELLKKYHVPFQTKVKIMGREIDFIVKNYAIEIDGHKQDVSKNWMLSSLGYNLIHLNNNEIPNPYLEEWFKNL
jgi:very-short-patch-repair endonuclease